MDEYIKDKKLCGFVRLSQTGKKRVCALAEKLGEIEELSDFEKNFYFYNLIEELSLKQMVSEPQNEAIPKQILDILEYIEKNFASIYSVEQVADEFYMSVTSLNRNFRKYIALSPHKLLMAKRLSHAEKLLREGSSVTDACYESGFRDCSRFIEHFKNRYGTTPLKYKNMMSG